MKIFTYIYFKLFPKKYIYNQYKTKQSYWKVKQDKDNSISDTNYTLW
jgi:hypothetical protein